MNWPGWFNQADPWVKPMRNWDLDDVEKAVDWNKRRLRLEKLRQWAIGSVIITGIGLIFVLLWYLLA